MIAKKEFDSLIFGVDYYRIESYDSLETLESEFQCLNNHHFMVDAKVDSSNLEVNNFLLKLKFKKVSTHIQLLLTGPNYHVYDKNKFIISNCLNITADQVMAHARNFVFDRFSMDIRISKDYRNRLYETWISNSLLNPNIYKATDGINFISFKISNDSINIDLSSVLNSGLGIGSNLMCCLLSFAADNNIANIHVITESENIGALNFYISNGFVITKSYSCYHYIK